MAEEQGGEKKRQRARDNGEGSFRLRPDGRWEGRLHVGWQDGRRIRRSYFGKTKTEAVAKWKEAKGRLDRGESIDDGAQPLEIYLKEWLRLRAKPTLRPRSFASYEQTLTLHVIPHLGSVPLQKVTAARVQKWLDERLAAGTSPRTCKYARAILRVALDNAVRLRILQYNPAALVRPPKYTRKESCWFDAMQGKALLQAAKESPVDGVPIEGIIYVGLLCGLRIGEILGLQWPDLDLDGPAATLTVRRTVGRVARRVDQVTKEVLEKGGIEIGEPKSKRSRRTLTLPALVKAALMRERTRQLEGRLALGKAWQGTEPWIFTSPIGTVLDHANVIKAYRKVLKAAGLPATARLHDLRHSCASLLLAQGVDVKTISDTLGHSQISITLDLYSHVAPALQAQAAAKLDEALTKAS